MHVILDTRPSRFSACNIEKLGVAWGRGYSVLAIAIVDLAWAERVKRHHVRMTIVNVTKFKIVNKCSLYGLEALIIVILKFVRFTFITRKYVVTFAHVPSMLCAMQVHVHIGNISAHFL